MVFPLISRVCVFFLVLFSIAGQLGFAQENLSNIPNSNDEQIVSKNTPTDLNTAKSFVKDAELVSSKIQKMLDQARREKDLVLITCINDKLAQANANLQIMNQRLNSLVSSQNSNDETRVKHEFSVISLINEKQKVLARSAGQCSGQDSFDTASTQNGSGGSTKIVASVSAQTAQAAAFESPPATLGSGAPTASGTSTTNDSGSSDSNDSSGSNGGTVQSPPLIPPPVSPIN